MFFQIEPVDHRHFCWLEATSKSKNSGKITIFGCISRSFHPTRTSENCDKCDTIKAKSETYDSVPFVRILWYSCTVQKPGSTAKDCSEKCLVICLTWINTFWHICKSKGFLMLGWIRKGWPTSFILREVKLGLAILLSLFHWSPLVSNILCFSSRLESVANN